MKKYLKLIALFSIGFIIISCQEKDEDKKDIELPSVYNFENAEYSNETDLLNQSTALIDLVKTANSGAKIEESKLLDMFLNTNGNGNGNFSFTSEAQIKSSLNSNAQALIEAILKELASVSGTEELAESGKAGMIKSPARSLLVNSNGQEYKELVEKGIMGAGLLYQITNVYLSQAGMNVDNSNKVEGKNYTAMEHNWDRAFGLFGATNVWPTDATGQRFWAKYSRKSSAEIANNVIDTPNDITEAFIKGRAAISSKDYTERDKQVKEVIKQLELIVSTTAISYLNSTIKNFSDDASRAHTLCEAYGCIVGLNYINDNYRIISSTEINELLAIIGTNFHNITSDNLLAVRNKLAEKYGLESVKENF